MNGSRRFVLAVGMVVLGASGTLIVERVRAAGVPTVGALTYSGTLTLPDGTAVTGPKNIGIGIFDAALAGNLVCQVFSAPVAVSAGHFQIPLPDACAQAVKASIDLWVDVQVDGASVGRTKFGAVPYAIETNHAMVADTAARATTADTAARATTADTAARATTADSASAGSALASGIATLQNQIAALQAPKPVFQVHNSNSTVAAGNTIVWNSVDFDTSSAYSTTTGLYTIPTAGKYEFYFDLLMPNAPAGEYRYSLIHNGSDVHTTIAYKAAATWQSLYNSYMIDCAQGDTVGVRFVSGSGNTYIDPRFNVFHGRML